MSTDTIAKSANKPLWSPESTGSWAGDNEVGHQIAATLIQQTREEGNPTHLGHMVKSMINRGEYGGAEAGFCHKISEALLS